MTVSAAVNSFSAPDTTVSPRARQRREDGFDQQLQSSAPGQMAQAASGAGVGGSAPGGAGHLLSSDLLRQIQALPGVAAATPTGR
ncbi:MAG TPA: hypothetical protein VNE67_07055 [Acetobacteraceae bacterium]|nr:hypothetical protein [Acetobacteraceae bacterium]